MYFSDLTMEIIRYRLIGPESHSVLAETLEAATVCDVSSLQEEVEFLFSHWKTHFVSFCLRNWSFLPSGGLSIAKTRATWISISNKRMFLMYWKVCLFLFFFVLLIYRPFRKLRSQLLTQIQWSLTNFVQTSNFHQSLQLFQKSDLNVFCISLFFWPIPLAFF